ncbi:glucoamylase family protein [Intrasporangium flavum]|uniref:glucoamylase family protein n=1 Tax=Intrasporangium flavum TaxID=1428657 RepID=UPI00096ED78F|nr:glucoamylase family protein [Intrasporangium flavum]
MSDRPTTSSNSLSSTPSRRSLLVGGAASLAAFALAPAASAGAATRTGSAPAFLRNGLGAQTRSLDAALVRTWAADTWRSLVAMTDPTTGLPADNIPESLAAGDRSGYTSPTNIGGYLWSTIAARELGIITRGEASARLIRTLKTVERMEHHTPSGMYYNWYDEATAKALHTWPDSGDTVVPFCSSVDNGWLGAALLVVQSSDAAAAPWAKRIFDRMRWDAFYNDNSDPAHQVRPGGLIHGGFYPYEDGRPGGTYQGTHIGGDPVWLTTHHYDTTVSETRITSYLGIVTGQIPAKQYFAMWRTFPATCDWSWHEMQPVGEHRTYYGIDVYEGAYTYRGMHVVPGWGGSMFEELMPDVFVPEAEWAPNSWGRNHPLHVRAQREHGLDDAGYGYWGFSPSSDPFAGYREYGVDALGLNPDGYFSDKERTNYDPGFGDCRAATNPNPTYGDGVVTPHAAFLAMMHEPDEAFTNLANLKADFDSYGRGGFFDAVAVRSGTVARRYLSLDQAMVMGVAGNVLGRGVIRRGFSTPTVEKRLRPVIGIEEFGAGIA